MEVTENSWTAEAEMLIGKLTRYPGPAFRKAYFSQLLASGSQLNATGSTRAAAYCFKKVAEALVDVPEEAIPTTPTGELQNDHAKTAPSELGQAAPLETLRHRWRNDRFRNAEAVLNRQASRLSALENQVYREKLDELKVAGDKAVTLLQATKVDDKLLELRRKLYKRVLVAQKVAIRVRPSPSTTLPEILGPGKAPASEFIVGPYNDRYNLGDLLTLIGKTDSPWVQEFLDLYRVLGSLKGLTPIAAA